MKYSKPSSNTGDMGTQPWKVKKEKEKIIY
jgi:hypothetical protein